MFLGSLAKNSYTQMVYIANFINILYNNGGFIAWDKKRIRFAMTTIMHTATSVPWKAQDTTIGKRFTSDL